jgi:predicted nucleic-acid-binding Zn-ribbon protein
MATYRQVKKTVSNANVFPKNPKACPKCGYTFFYKNSSEIKCNFKNIEQ